MTSELGNLPRKRMYAKPTACFYIATIAAFLHYGHG